MQDDRCFPCSVLPLLQSRQAASAPEKRQALVEPSGVRPWLPAVPTPANAPGRALRCPALAPPNGSEQRGSCGHGVEGLLEISRAWGKESNF